jgi:hypothetical protein
MGLYIWTAKRITQHKILYLEDNIGTADIDRAFKEQLSVDESRNHFDFISNSNRDAIKQGQVIDIKKIARQEAGNIPDLLFFASGLLSYLSKNYYVLV